MPIYADSNRASLRFAKESNTNWGVTPTSGVTKEMRITSSSLAANKDTVVSDELRFDRMVSAVTEVSASTSGDANFEFSAGAQDDFLAYFLLGAFSTPLSFHKFEGTTVSVATSTTIEITGGDYTNYFAASEIIRLSGFLSQANNDFATVVSASYSSPVTTVTISGPTLVAEAGNTRSKLQKAEDAIVVRDNTISAVNSTSSFDSSGTPFGSLITAGKLVVGQKLNITGLGHEEKTVTFTGTPADGETITLNDGNGGIVVFEFDTSADGVASGSVSIKSDDTPTVTVLAARLAAAINSQANAGNINVSATSSVGVTTLKNLGNSGMTTTGVVTNVSYADTVTGEDTSNGIFTITSLANNQIGVSPAPADVSAGALVTIQGSMLRNPSGETGGTLPHQVITPQSVSIQTGFEDIGQFFLHDGMRVGGYSLSVASGSIVTGSMSFQGRATTRGVTDTLGDTGTYTVLEAPSNEVMNATTNVGTLELNGTALSTGIQSIELNGESSLRSQPGVGSKYPTGIGTGRFNLTGSVVAYFADASLYNAFINHDTVALSFSFTDLDSNVYVYTLPSLKFTSDPVTPTGIDQDVMENLEFVAFRDAATKAMIQVDRFSNVTPVGSHA